jgi:hypothetical protein
MNTPVINTDVCAPTPNLLDKVFKMVFTQKKTEREEHKYLKQKREAESEEHCPELCQ